MAKPQGLQTPWNTCHTPTSAGHMGTHLCPGLSQGLGAEEVWAQLTAQTCSGGEAGVQCTVQP